MAIILNIDTATAVASINLANNGELISSRVNAVQKDHAAFLHVSIKEMLLKENLNVDMLSAIAVTEGPGSYTGLRIGMAAAKGIAYAKDLPLITCSSLLCLAGSVKNKIKDELTLICPMIDARRMEVFMALYDEQLNEIISPRAMILDKQSLAEWFEKKIIFTGNGSEKFEPVFGGRQGEFFPETDIRSAFGSLSYHKFLSKDFADLAYAVPTYIKEFQST